MVRLILGFIFCVLSGIISAQPDTLLLPEFQTTEFRFRQLTDFIHAVEQDSAATAFFSDGPVVNLLQHSFPVLIRSNGPSSSVTISNRGLAAAHTAVFWEGININSPTTGVADISLIPAAFVQNIALTPGGASAVMGSGSIGGGIHLNHRRQMENPIHISVTSSASSISNFETSARAQVAEGNWQSETNLLWHHGQNRYGYYNHARKGNPLEFRESNNFLQYGLTQHLSRKMGRHRISIDFWALETDREIPPSLTSANLHETQTDRNLKFVAQTHLNFRRLRSRIQFGFLNDEMTYTNIQENNALIRNHVWLLNADFTAVLSTLFQLNFGVNHTFQQVAVANNYTRPAEMLTNARYAGLNYLSENRKVGVNLMLRYDGFSDYTNALSPSLSLNLHPSQWLEWQIALSRNYRIPGFNDRFWFPGGDPDLPPEDALHASTGPKLQLFKQQNSSLQLDINGYYNYVDNWIQWVPQGNYWGAVSYKSVFTSGVNVTTEYQRKWQHAKFTASGNYVFTRAQNLENHFDQDFNGNLLPHIPQHKTTGTLSFAWHGVSTFLNGAYTGSRFIAADNRRELEPFFVSNAGLGYRHQLGSFQGALQFKIHNLTNTNYQIMPWMPMPLRYYSLSLKIAFVKSKTT